VLFLARRYVIPTVEFGAALPFHVEFFFLGAASYFFYKGRAAHQLSDTAFPVAFCLAAFLLWLSGLTRSLIPVVLWMAFFGLLLEQPSSLSSRVVAPLFTNPLVLYLGRISYSLYLSHALVIIVIQAALLKWAPSLSQIGHFGMLLACTMPATVAVSTVLYRYLEAPGIQAGRTLVHRFDPRRNTGEQEANAYSRGMSWG
jgi:peptidoglycan/LPS O-acetylase OafA/YrhL